MSIEVNVVRTEKVTVTSDNEMAVLGAEWDRRYSGRPFIEGREVEFAKNGKQRHVEHFGEDHIGKRGIVVGLSENGADVKVLSINLAGVFVELWTPEAVLVAIG
jgi:hypothetical protein